MYTFLFMRFNIVQISNILDIYNAAYTAKGWNAAGRNGLPRLFPFH